MMKNPFSFRGRIESMEPRLMFDNAGLFGHSVELVADLNTLPAAQLISQAEVVDGTLKVMLEDGNGDVELWDLGESADDNAQKVVEIDAHATCNVPGNLCDEFMPLVHGGEWIDGNFFFSFSRVKDSDEFAAWGPVELWRSDGTQAGTNRIHVETLPLSNQHFGQFVITPTPVGGYQVIPSFYQHSDGILLFFHSRHSDGHEVGFLAVDSSFETANLFDSRWARYTVPLDELVPLTAIGISWMVPDFGRSTQHQRP